MKHNTRLLPVFRISALLWSGPVSTLMVGEDGERQRQVIERAIERGLNWFDTAATYGAGQSETNLGRVLEELGTGESVHVATKVRLMPEDLDDIPGFIRQSVHQSLQRLRLPRITLLQLHNSITPARDDEPTSLTPEDVLGTHGIAETFEELKASGLVQQIGLTGIGHPDSLAEVVRSGRFATMQVPYHLLNPSAGRNMPDDFAETNYGNIIEECAQQQMGVLAIRVMAGGALADSPPSPHTFKTPFFPLALYERDRHRAAQLQNLLRESYSLPQVAVQFALNHPSIHSALIGFGEPDQVDEALAALNTDSPLPDWDELLTSVLTG
ncbi:MAG: aldo/keto reductase [Planctomycetaceae bacterium]